MKTYLIVSSDHTTHRVEADYCFENQRQDGVALVLREGSKGSTNVVASFAPGGWLYYKTVQPDNRLVGLDPIPDNEPDHPEIDVEDPRFYNNGQD